MFRYYFVFLFILFSSTSLAEERKGPDINIGAGVHISSLTAKTKDTGATLGEFEQTIATPFILYDSPAIIDGDRVDMIIKAGYGHFELDRQQPNYRAYDNGTSVDGDYVYITPMFYVYPTRYGSTSYFSQGLRYGLGLGFGYLRANGRMAYYGYPGETYAVDVNELGLKPNIE